MNLDQQRFSDVNISFKIKNNTTIRVNNNEMSEIPNNRYPQ